VGPRPFQRSEADLFFGRDREARGLRSRWLAHKIVVLHGRAGTGKSSLVNAGVLPLLSDQDHIDVLAVGKLTSQPATHDGRDNAYRHALLSSWSSFGPMRSDLSISEFFSARSQLHAERGHPQGVLAAIDQFEEVFAAFPGYDQQCERLVDELADALRDIEALRILIILRDDHLRTFQHYQRRLSPFRPFYFQLDALTPRAALNAVLLPLAGTGRSFGAGVAERLVGQLRTFTLTDRLNHTVAIEQDLVEPLPLQLACRNLWDALPDDVVVITSENLRAFGDAEQAVADFYSQAVRAVCRRMDQTDISERRLRDWIEQAFITERGTRGMVLRGITTTGTMPNSVADALAEQLILTPEFRNNSTWYQLSQDQLIDAVRHANRRWRSVHGLSEDKPAKTPADFRSAAEAAFAAGEFGEAQRLIGMAVDSYRRSAGHIRDLAHALELQGELARANGDLVRAERGFQDALLEFSILGDATAQARLLSVLGDVYSALGDYVKAVQFHQQASERIPADVDALTGLGYAQWHWGSPADAEATFTRALNSDHDKAEALAGRGQARIDLRDYRAALADLDRALRLRLSPDSEIDARSARAVALADLGRRDEAERELWAAKCQDPGRPRTRLRVARVDAALGRNDEARSELMQALQAQPPLPPGDESGARKLLARLTDTA
jgi:tetratricopeptide (TPR) repeat protein